MVSEAIDVQNRGTNLKKKKMISRFSIQISPLKKRKMEKKRFPNMLNYEKKETS
jgi:hypothetical protein